MLAAKNYRPMQKQNPQPKLLWEHRNPSSTRIYEFQRHLESRYGLQLQNYEDLHQWSVTHLNHFWEEVWYFTGVKASKPFTKVGLQSLLNFLQLTKERLGCRRRCSHVPASIIFHKCKAEFCGKCKSVQICLGSGTCLLSDSVGTPRMIREYHLVC